MQQANKQNYSILTTTIVSTMVSKRFTEHNRTNNKFLLWDWSKQERCFVSLYIHVYMYTPTNAYVNGPKIITKCKVTGPTKYLPFYSNNNVTIGTLLTCFYIISIMYINIKNLYHLTNPAYSYYSSVISIIDYMSPALFRLSFSE